MTGLPVSTPRAPSLDDRYELEEGRVFLSGLQALIRLMFDQKRRDTRAGLRTGTFVSGYPGSPLGGIDVALRGVTPFLEKYDIRHLPAQNEELAATSLMGTQMIDDHPHSEYDGVVSFWYGKGPGIDRANDALKHGNFAGTSKHGAVVILSGEDHEAKSSSVPYQQEFSFEHMGIPVLYPATVGEFLHFGQHAVAMSRYSGCWVALKLVGPLCDGGETVKVSPDSPAIRVPRLNLNGRPFEKRTDFTFFPGKNIATEKALYYERHEAVRSYARENKLDRIVVCSKDDRIGIVSSGKSFTDVRQALVDLGYDEAALQAAGIRLLKLGLLCPMDSEIIKEFAEGLDQVIVVEEKRDFLERQIGRILCDLDRPPRLIGKFDGDGLPLFAIESGMEHDQVTEQLGRVLLGHKVSALPDRGHDTLVLLDEVRGRQLPPTPHRKPNFCSGCPHNIGTRLADGQVAWGSPGCHIFAILMSEPKRRIEAVTQYGGEGLPWIGLSPFTDRKHMIQNVGDGSLFHSSYLNVRYAISTGVSMTFKILYNGAIANTGGQPPVAASTIPQLAKLLATEGVVRTVIVTKDRGQYAGAGLPSETTVCEPPDMEVELSRLEATKGVTVLIYDGQCANERRRRQKRGIQAKPTSFTVVNEDVCENCGHCGEVANCMSLQKVDTPFGTKTRIHQSSCNQDQTCLEGECPSFVTVTTKQGGGFRKPPPPRIADAFPEPVLPSIDTPFHIYTPGLGGTGVITLNAILAQAVTLDGNKALSFDQTGAAQKWGSVLSSLIVKRLDDETVTANSIGLGRANLYLALDLMAASDSKNLARCSPDNTASVINSAMLPSGDMIRDVRLSVPTDPMVSNIRMLTDPKRSVTLAARTAAEALFGDYMMTNVIALGAAYQAGFLPITAASLEQAIRMNGVQIDKNMTAFRAGRLAVHDPSAFEEIVNTPIALLADRTMEMTERRSAASRTLIDRLMDGFAIDPETRTVIAIRIEDLAAYQNASYAAKYAALLREVAECEASSRNIGQDGDVETPLTRLVAQNLHKLMAYKDEYEVARLLTQRDFVTNVKASFDGDAKVYFNLQPPLLRHFGLKKKVRFGAWSIPILKLLAMCRFLRGTPFDPFGRAEVRREERRLITWYTELLKAVLADLSPANLDVASLIAKLPEDIRGYEHIKLRNLPEVRKRADGLVQAMKDAAGKQQEAAE